MLKMPADRSIFNFFKRSQYKIVVVVKAIRGFQHITKLYFHYITVKQKLIINLWRRNAVLHYQACTPEPFLLYL